MKNIKDFSMLDEPGHYMWPGNDTGDTKKSEIPPKMI